ncbi:hypothetical protein [Kitasatospora sp. NPDC092286]|uniref:hypothetical protein n=1 Tax=Kitasatospora sp. NPDC092286 TaxID=3364087 RepID=UPI003806EE77
MFASPTPGGYGEAARSQIGGVIAEREEPPALPVQDHAWCSTHRMRLIGVQQLGDVVVLRYAPKQESV